VPVAPTCTDWAAQGLALSIRAADANGAAARASATTIAAGNTWLRRVVIRLIQ
jgi:hypothetical protein